MGAKNKWQLANICYRCKKNKRSPGRSYCSPCITAHNRNYRQNHGAEIVKRCDVDKTFGAGAYELYKKLQLEQSGRCKICRRSEDELKALGFKKYRLCIDHCHATGLIRGLLCINCNRAAGWMDDDPSRAIRLAEYLNSQPTDFVVNNVGRRQANPPSDICIDCKTNKRRMCDDGTVYESYCKSCATKRRMDRKHGIKAPPSRKKRYH